MLKTHFACPIEKNKNKYWQSFPILLGMHWAFGPVNWRDTLDRTDIYWAERKKIRDSKK